MQLLTDIRTSTSYLSDRKQRQPVVSGFNLPDVNVLTDKFGFTIRFDPVNEYIFIVQVSGMIFK
jgi:hypothetical protein